MEGCVRATRGCIRVLKGFKVQGFRFEGLRDV